MTAITLQIPVTEYGKLATAAALHGVPVDYYICSSYFAATVKVAKALPAPAPSTPAPESKPHES